MAQTFLAITALALAALLGLQQIRANHQAQRSDIADDVQAGAARAVADRLESLRVLPFDEALKGPGPFVSPAAMTVYTAPEAGGAGFTPDTPADDIDDFDGQNIEVRMAMAADTVAYSVWTEVRYALDDGSLAPAGTPTRTKRVTVAAAPTGSNSPRADTVRLTDIHTCASPCLW